MMALAGACAAGAQIAMTYGFLHLPVAQGALLQMLVPLGVAIGGVVFFAEHFAPHELIGAALILGGTAVTAARR
jgi:drug/metabolite transporter (DMT)-like permease